MAEARAVNEQDVLAFMATAHKALSLREIAAAMGIRHAGRRALAKMIPRLKRRGEIVEIRNGRFKLAESGAAQQGKKDKSERGDRGQRGEKAAQGPAARKSSGETTLSAPSIEIMRSAQSGQGNPSNVIEGRLVAHRDGYGFVVPATPIPGIAGDLFIGAGRMGDAMHGDRVLARIDRGRSRGDGRMEGSIVRVVDRAHATIVGIFRYGAEGNSVAPYESRLQQEIVIPPGQELTSELRAKLGPQAPRRGVRLPELDGAVVDVELTRFPQGGVPASGRVIEILGRPGEMGVDTEIMIRKHHLPHRFPEDVLEEARAVAQPVGEAERAGREDFRDLPIVTIDGETARDFDDAVHVRPLGNGRWELQVHIADVAHYVRRDSLLDAEARVRGTSVYFPDRAVPMLPEELSNNICSLRPHEERLVMSVVMEIGAEGDIRATRIAPGLIRSAERMTYTLVHAVLEGDPDASARYAHLAPHFRDMRDLAMILNARRVRMGSIDFDLPEAVIEFDDAGQMIGIARSERNVAHRIIEEFMLAANQAVARYLENWGVASLHRVHEKPDPKRVLEFEELAHAFGYSLGVEGLSEKQITVKHGGSPAHRGEHGRGKGRHGRSGGGREKQMTVSLPGTMDIDIRPQHYQLLTARIAGKPEERILSYLMLRSLKQARYSPEALGHFALAFDQYTHFTSPIRRYPDLIVHRILKWALHHVAPGAQSVAGPYSAAELDAIAKESSEAERRAEGAERELKSWKTAQFMEQHLGEEFDALIVSIQKFGFFVELVELFVEGLVPINRLEELTGERCFYRESDRTITAGRPGTRRSRVWRLGDRIRVRAERIDPLSRRVEFSQIE
ncbi:MAG: RNB domain-containing ribonuclease [Candidatus Acidiferrales bacterium]|jgi:ribonuclease R